MAKQLKAEQITLDIIINGNKAQKEIYELDKATRKLKESNVALKAEQVSLIKKGVSKQSIEYKNLSAEIRKNNSAMKQNKARVSELQKEIGLTSLTMAQLKKRAKELRLSLLHAIPNSPNAKKLQTELAAINNRMRQLNGAANQQKLSFSSAANWMNKYQTIILGITATITGVVFSLQQMIDYNNKLSDAMSSVEKTTGMTKQEVEELAKSFGMLNTRTSRIDLLRIAEEAGRIGIAKEDIAGFVETMNMAVVALGDSFQGGVSEVAEKLGKLKNAFQETKDLKVDQAYNAIGSAINDLGASGNASESNIANFAQRIGSMSEQLKPSISQALGLGAAFEESSIQAEIAGRGYSIFLKQASTNTEKFAKVMGVSNQEVKKMINDDPLEFFLKFSDHLNKTSKSATDMASKLNDLGLNADGVNKIVGAAGNNIDRFRELIDLSGQSMIEGTSLTEEYGKMNNNLAGIYEKLQKKIKGIFSSDLVVSWLTASVEWIAKFVGATDDADGSVTRWRVRLVFLAKILAIVTAALLSFKAAAQLTALWTNRLTLATKLHTIAVKANALTSGLLKIVLSALQIVYFKLTGNIAKAAVAQRMLNIAMASNPYGLVVALIVAIVAAFVLFNDELDESIESQKELNDVMNSAEKSIIKQKNELLRLIAVAKDETQSKENRLKAIKKINEISPKYLGFLTLETLRTKKAEKAINDYVRSLQRAATVKAYQAKIDKLEAERLDAEMNVENKTEALVDQDVYGFVGSIKEYGRYVGSIFGGDGSLSGQIEEATDQWTASSDKLDKVMLAYQDYIKKNPELALSSTDEEDSDTPTNIGKTLSKSSSTSSTPSGPSRDKKREAELDKLKAINQEYYNSLLELQQYAQDTTIAQMKDGYDKELAELDLSTKRKIDKLKEQLISEEYILQLKNQKNIAAKKGDKEREAILANTINNMEVQNAEIHSLLLQEEIIFQNKKNTIQLEYSQKEIAEEYSDYEKLKQQRQLQFDENLLQIESTEEAKAQLKGTYTDKELKDIDTWEKAKSALQKEHDLKELDEQEKFLQTLLTDLQTAVETGVFEGINLDGMTPEQKEEFQAYIESVKGKIIELGIKKKDLANGGNDDKGTGEETSVSLGGSVDIFGMSPEQWHQLFINLDEGKNSLESVLALVRAMHNAFSKYYEFVNKKENDQLQKFESASQSKQDALQHQLDQGYISQETFNTETEKLEMALNKRRAEIEYKQAKRQKQMSIAQTVMNTAQAIMGIWAQVPKVDFGIAAGILTGMVGALGAAQIGMIASTPLPAKGFEKGLYPVKREQDGKLFNAEFGGESKTGLSASKPTLYLAGEKGPEMIIHNDALKSFSPNLSQQLYKELAMVKGFEKGYYPNNNNNSQGSNEELQAAIHFLSKNVSLNNQLLNKLISQPIQAQVSNKDLKSMKNIESGIKDFNTLRNKSKIS